MTAPAPHVTVIGAGIVGASIAHALSNAGASVRLVDRLAAPGRGVTARSFGWVNTVIGEPGSDDDRRRRSAFARFARLNQELGGRLFEPRKGSLVWEASEVETRSRAQRWEAAGSRSRLIGRAEIAALAPALADPPPCAIHSPDDLAIETERAAALLAAAAREAGAEILLGRKVLGVDTAAGRIVGVRLAEAVLPTDAVVVAAGTATAALLADVAPDLGVAASPSVLIELDAAPGAPALDVILCGPELEIRQRDDSSLVAAECAPPEASAADLERLGRQTLQAARRLLPGLRDPRIRSVEIGARPVTNDGAPLVGRLAAVPSLMVAVAHPGVILAPALAEAVLALVFDRAGAEIEPGVIGA